MRKGIAIHPIHASVKRLRNLRLRPRDMETMAMSPEQAEGLHDIAMSIFADCSNVGVPFQEAIMAVYLSGLEHGSSLSKETQNGH